MTFKQVGIDPDTGATIIEYVDEYGEENSVESFPYQISDLIGWAIKRKDGTLVKYTLRDPNADSARVITYPRNQVQSSGKSLSEWCNHNPAILPTFSSGQVNLFIADGLGVKNHKDEFDLVIDCGGVIPLPFHSVDGVLKGDGTLVKGLETYVDTYPNAGCRLFKIDWYDRKAPPLQPEFWVKLAELLGAEAGKGTDQFDVVINCQGGHGRSGTALVCLMMVLNPEYGAREAIMHLRAIHCPRAIESIEQHGYIDLVATWLGQTANAREAIGITNYKEEFKKLTLASAKPYQDRLK